MEAYIPERKDSVLTWGIELFNFLLQNQTEDNQCSFAENKNIL